LFCDNWSIQPRVEYQMIFEKHDIARKNNDKYMDNYFIERKGEEKIRRITVHNNSLKYNLHRKYKYMKI
jgi:hypothetical protein